MKNRVGIKVRIKLKLKLKFELNFIHQYNFFIKSEL